MSYRWLKLIVVLSAALLLWMAASAFRQPSSAASTIEPEDVSLAESNFIPTSEPTPDHTRHLKALPAIARSPVNPDLPLPVDSQNRPIVDWNVLASTAASGKFPPAYPKNLKSADERDVVLTGYMCPLDEAGDMGTFLLLEVPVGCFYCLAPSPTNIVMVELGGGRREPLHYELVKITGRLALNQNNPEDFFYTIRDAKLSLAD